MVGSGMQAGQQVAGYGHQMAQNGLQFGHHMAQNGFQHGGDMASRGIGYGKEGLTYGNRMANVANQYNPGTWLWNMIPDPLKFSIPILQIIFAVVYYCSVVSQYPYWNGPTPMSCQLQSEPAPCATTSTSPTNCCLAWCCPQARAAHTFDRTGTLEYWCGLLAMFLCPFCTLCYANACTDLNPKLGGEPANVIASAACTWCCSCCVIAQDAESLDACTGARTEVCGVSGGMPYGAYGGPMMMPGQKMMQPGYMY